MFALTAPWTISGRTIGRFSAPLGVSLAALAAALAARRSWRTWAIDALRYADIRLARRDRIALGAAVAAFLARVALAKFAALQINAWDFSLYFDRPVDETLHGRTLYSAFLGTSALADNASFFMFAFVPLHALRATPLWLVLAPALAIAAAAIVASLLFRSLLDDDLAGAVLAAAFVFHASTARAVQYGFHVEIFYPLAIFLLLWAWHRGHPAVFAASVVATLTIKADAILPLTAFAVGALFAGRRRGWAAAAGIAALAGFALDYFIVLPRFSPSRSAAPWFSWYWAPYGATPLRAAVGMAVRPLRTAADAAGSGIVGMLEPLLFTPIAGIVWLGAALAAFLPYAVARHAKLARFSLYYGMPVLPFLFVAAAAGIARVSRRFGGNARTARRVAALAVLATCALDGPGYVFPAARPERRQIAPLLATAAAPAGVLVQGALLPHAGYRRDLEVLQRGTERPDGQRGFLLDLDADPYPFTANELARLAASLESDPRYAARGAAGRLRLFLPRSSRG